MKLDDALRQFADKSGLDADDLIAFAAEDTIGGYDRGAGTWPAGAIFGDDGKFIYAIVRAMKPNTVVEFGIGQGCASKHILAALVKNRKGKLHSYDHTTGIYRDRYTSAELKRWEPIPGNALTYPLAESADLVFEDTDHSVETTAALAERAMSLKTQVFIAHDSEHYMIGETVKEGLRVLPWFVSMKLENTDCGLAYWCESAVAVPAAPQTKKKAPTKKASAKKTTGSKGTR